MAIKIGNRNYSAILATLQITSYAQGLGASEKKKKKDTI